jgi:hypothetical protein
MRPPNVASPYDRTDVFGCFGLLDPAPCEQYRQTWCEWCLPCERDLVLVPSVKNSLEVDRHLNSDSFIPSLQP